MNCVWEYVMGWGEQPRKVCWPDTSNGAQKGVARPATEGKGGTADDGLVLVINKSTGTNHLVRWTAGGDKIWVRVKNDKNA